MNKTIALREFNKRSETDLDAVEFSLIESMKLYDKGRVHEAFTALTGREISKEDVALAILIIELSEALIPPTTLIRDSGPSPFNWPPLNERPLSKPWTSTLQCRGHSLLS